jgi:hypothetical protein
MNDRPVKFWHVRSDRPEMFEAEDGQWVAAADYDRLRADVERELIAAQCGFCRHGRAPRRVDNHLKFGPPIVWTHDDDRYLGECLATRIHEHLYSVSGAGRQAHWGDREALPPRAVAMPKPHPEPGKCICVACGHRADVLPRFEHDGKVDYFDPTCVGAWLMKNPESVIFFYTGTEVP